MIKFCKLLDIATGAIEPNLDPALISDHRDHPGKVIWLDIEDPVAADFALLAEEFCFHPLALEDCQHAHQRPKLEQYEGYIFIVLYEVVSDAAAGRTRAIEIELFLGSNYVVTIHRQPAPALTTSELRWTDQGPRARGEEGADFLAYMIVDGVVDSYFPLLDVFSDRLEELEDSLFVSPDQHIVREVFRLKKDVLQLRRLVTPLRDVFLVLLRGGTGSVFSRHTHVYFQDILDHLLRISDAIDTHRDLVGSAVDVYMSAVSNRTNDTMKKLTVLSTVLMSMALIAGIYGMNFKHMPELEWRQGYPVALASMAVLGAVLVGLFRWKRYI